MLRLMPNQFDPESEAIVVRDFTFAGKPMKKDDVFPHKELKVISFDLQGLWTAGLVRFTGKPAQAAPPSPKVDPRKSAQATR